MRLALASLAFAAALLAGQATAADAERGRDLYTQRCGACHDRSVHARRERVARDFGQVRAWVERWSRTLGLGWGAEEIEDVASFLNETYYRFAGPAPKG